MDLIAMSTKSMVAQAVDVRVCGTKGSGGVHVSQHLEG
jgi:hypothetical protein